MNLGGDLRVRGIGPGRGPWTISIDHPRHDGPLALVGLYDGAVASSTVLRRQWRVDGERRHHLIDPHTGQPSRSDVAFASALAAEGWQAEAMAKAFLLRGTTLWSGTTLPTAPRPARRRALHRLRRRG